MDRPDAIAVFAPGYLGRAITDEPLYLHALARRRLSACRRIVDVGCGIGKLRATFPEAELVGVDLREGAAACLQRGYARFIQADLEAEPLPDLGADGVILSHVLEHFLRPERALAHALRAAAPGAVVYAVAPTRANPKYWDDYTHVRPFSERSLLGLLADAGLSDVRPLYALRPPARGAGRLLRLVTHGDPEREQALAARFPQLRAPWNVQALAVLPLR